MSRQFSGGHGRPGGPPEHRKVHAVQPHHRQTALHRRAGRWHDTGRVVGRGVMERAVVHARGHRRAFRRHDRSAAQAGRRAWTEGSRSWPTSLSLSWMHARVSFPATRRSRSAFARQESRSSSRPTRPMTVAPGLARSSSTAWASIPCWRCRPSMAMACTNSSMRSPTLLPSGGHAAQTRSRRAFNRVRRTSQRGQVVTRQPGASRRAGHGQRDPGHHA